MYHDEINLKLKSEGVFAYHEARDRAGLTDNGPISTVGKTCNALFQSYLYDREYLKRDDLIPVAIMISLTPEEYEILMRETDGSVEGTVAGISRHAIRFHSNRIKRDGPRPSPRTSLPDFITK